MFSATNSQTPSSSASDSNDPDSKDSISSQVSSSSASTSPPSWDVFLSFRGEDTRYNFTGHLYAALDRHGLRTFMDDPELRRGEVISHGLKLAIQNSKIYIVVFSENYASSCWCLDELAEIYRCYKTLGRSVFGLYYNIDVSTVRYQTGSFKKAFEKHGTRFARKMEKVHRWRQALASVANLSGKSIPAERSHAEIINNVVDEILLKLKTKALDVAKFPVGLDSRVKDMTAELSRDVELMTSSTYNRPSSCSDSSSQPTQWEVFLCFRGSDTRYTFYDYANDALHRAGIRTFCFEKLPSGEEISSALLQAIHESRTYIVVFSEDFASSLWCLDELVEILQCHKIMKRLVIPVFYNIDPSIVRHQTQSFKEAFRKHLIRFEMERVERWRLTLTEVSKFSGYHISKDRSEAYFINEIVDRILLEINPKSLDVSKYPVGLDSRVKGITTLLSSGTRGIIKFGIYGMVGVGKTTLAKVLYNQLLLGGSFSNSCFLANVSAVSGTFKGLESLQKKLINDVIKSKKRFEVDNVEEGIKVIRDRICSEKVLVLTDDVSNLKQYESLVGPFASGSVVIITTRDEEILNKIEVEHRYRYKVNELDDEESLTLFTKHAFGNAEPDNTLMVFSKDILRLAGGLPLALEVFGSQLYKQSKAEWIYYIDKLQRIPNSSIAQKLKISLDPLESDDPVLMEIFLDIACFFIGRKKGEVLRIMETYFSHADHHINILRKRCLLTINNTDVLGMHDLLRDMGREIARNKFPNNPGKHSRLWKGEDISAVLKKDKGTEAIEGIIPSDFYYPKSLEGVSLDAEAFKRMTKLRFLYLEYINLTGNFDHTFESLRWLRWEFCPLKCLPSDFYPQNLVVLELPRSEMRTIWEPNMVSHVFAKLTTLNMKYSLHLATTPDFTSLPCLETLNLEYCESLLEVHTSIGILVRLISINLHGCLNLRSLPDTICNLRAVRSLDIGGCSSLDAMPIELGNIGSLTELNASGLTVSHLPDSVERLSRLVVLKLSKITNLGTLPELPSTLKWIIADGCMSIERLPDISNLKQLEILELTDCSALTEIHGLMELTSLRKLHLRGCNSSFLAYTFTKRFFQILSRFGPRIEIYIGLEEFPSWISKASMGSTRILHFPSNLSRNLVGLILCFEHTGDFDLIKYSVENTTSGFILQGSLENYNHDSLMVIVPSSVFSVVDGDDRIEFRTTNADIIGIHLLQKQEITKIDEYDSANLIVKE